MWVGIRMGFIGFIDVVIKWVFGVVMTIFMISVEIVARVLIMLMVATFLLVSNKYILFYQLFII